MTNLSRREILLGAAASAAALGVSAAASAASFGNPDSPAEGRINGKSRTSLDDPGPQNPALANQFPSFQDPPATDINGMPLFWASFNNAHKRYQNGGWARQVTQDDFAISEDISGVNMRLAENGVREMHWHQQAEWAIMLDGKCRITILDELGRAQVADVKTGDLWYFPPGLPHSLQGLGSTGAEFLLAFDGRIHHLEKGYWLKFEIRRIEPGPRQPHGLRYSFTLHDPRGRRLIGFDNAHVAPARRRRPARVDRDHRHRLLTIRPYQYRDAATLLADFWAEVDSVLKERGVLR